MLRAGLSLIRVPTLVVYGTADPVPPPACALELQASIAGASLLRLPAAHLTNVETGDAFTENVLAFLLQGGGNDGRYHTLR